uniref:Uncharacterized protein n=1 Tax=viral metagenome TaxID=1070528 RepID=A0A6M3J1J7_9ZZZZ
MRTRSTLYLLARILGDVNAVRRGRVVARLWNRTVGRIVARFTPWR